MRNAPQILVADDNELNRKIVKRQLDRLGFSSRVVEGGAEAVAACQSAVFDMIFMDVQMSDMDGLTATRAIRSRESTHRTPIIAVTANDDLEELERCLDAGMDDFFAKPIRLGPLARLLVRWGAHGDAATGAPGADPPAILADHSLERLHQLELACGQGGLRDEIMREFCELVPARLRRLKKALERGDPAKAERERFALLMNSRGMGALRLVRLAEDMGAAHDAAERARLAEKAEEAFAQVADALAQRDA